MGLVVGKAGCYDRKVFRRTGAQWLEVARGRRGPVGMSKLTRAKEGSPGAPNGSTQAEPNEGVVPPGDERALRRLDSLLEVPAAARERARERLLSWGAQVEDRFGRSLPAPYVFANDYLQIEFEWETPQVDLALQLLEDGSVDYLLTRRASGTESDSEGTAPAAEVCALLAHLFK